ncbi:MAG: hypothetical protein JWN65_3204 [Solirubrobacterales bacterium]|nr:hypothetical protein [Solirubrobacterales bacterium]
MSHRLPRARSLAVLVCLAGAVPAVATSSAAAAAPTASAAKTCSGFAATKPGGGYFLSLKATGLSCSSAKKVARSHNSCRLKKGRKATCTRVSGYKCTERRGQAIPTEYSSTVTCKKGSKQVVYSYQQDT